LPGKVNDFEAGILILFVLGICVRQFLSRRGGSGLLRMSTTLFGLMYVPWLLNFIQKLHFFPDIVEPGGARIEIDGNFYVLYFILVTKFSDLGAYCVGSLIGKHKMIPRISPGKTWEGLWGALAAAAVYGLAWIALARDATPALVRDVPWSTAWMLILVVGLTALSVIGDLFESAMKRQAGLKDSGGLLPGHGGVLDRIDALTPVLPVAALVCLV
jgi:phosphatidate cytidylyltransferase